MKYISGPSGLDPYADRYRCSTDDGMTCDLVRDRGVWVLERVWGAGAMVLVLCNF
ncbi:hypothetical protein [Desulforamulus aeronauticus]|uniref:hypothetical protein n=1 Tax=Desulforamulus aeronauticus TaxID=53343 RepID=UPI001587A2EC|nr:hypothetical protein [Desulforamulus aeronauticus]